MKRFVFSVTLSSIAVLMVSPVHAAYTVKDGKLIHMNEIATLSVQEHYSLATESLEAKNWPELIRQSQVIIKNFPETAFAWDCYFYLGEAYFHLHELDLANANFSTYLKQVSPKYFEAAMEYKFRIAKLFENGAKRHLLGLESMPKWMPARQQAIEIYDEVIMALPQHDLGVEALLGKGNLLLRAGEFKESVETFQTLIRRFPKHPLACDSYIAITNVYLKQSKENYPDPDYLELAEINTNKFKVDFPGHPKVMEVEKMLGEMKEVFAIELYKTAQFYERTKKPGAAMIYYSKIITKYPNTKTTVKSEKRQEALQKKYGKKEEDKDPALKKEEGLIVESSERQEEIADASIEQQDISSGKQEKLIAESTETSNELEDTK